MSEIPGTDNIDAVTLRAAQKLGEKLAAGMKMADIHSATAPGGYFDQVGMSPEMRRLAAEHAVRIRHQAHLREARSPACTRR